MKNVDLNTILIASNNQSKIDDYGLYIGDAVQNILTLKDTGKNITVREGVTSIEENAIAKARTWAVATNMLTIADDTGFYLNGLYGEPGAAVRRWGGELGEDATGEQFWRHLQKKTLGLDDLSCYFDQCVVIYSPSGEYEVVHNRNDGMLNKEKLNADFNGTDYPLGAAFEATNRNKTWDEMSDEEKVQFDAKFIDDIQTAINRLKNRVRV